ncbi:hypothetical protein Fot_05935 [Forsythia ovata]|uniref:Uncharacterized protein n=1 Tax=Forsythia ovata TaxID=205694 RepID=A0ABD1WRK9_9LAMI
MFDNQIKGRRLSMMKEKRLCQKGSWKMKIAREILGGPSEAGRLFFGKLEKPFLLIDVQIGPQFLPSTAGSSVSILGSRQDELDPAILEKLPVPSAIAATSIHKYWTSAWAKAGAEDIEELRSENKIIRSRLAVSEDARAKVENKISMAEMIQILSVKAQEAS